jgi:hypothetical protein
MRECAGCPPLEVQHGTTRRLRAETAVAEMLEEGSKEEGVDFERLGRAAGMAQQLLRWLHPLAATLAGRRLLCRLLGGAQLLHSEPDGRPEQEAPGVNAREAALQMLDSASAVLELTGADAASGPPARACDEPVIRWGSAPDAVPQPTSQEQLQTRHEAVRQGILALARQLQRGAMQDSPYGSAAAVPASGSSDAEQWAPAGLQSQAAPLAPTGDSLERHAFPITSQQELASPSGWTAEQAGQPPASAAQQPALGEGAAGAPIHAGAAWLETCIMQLPYFDKDVAKDVRSLPGVSLTCACLSHGGLTDHVYLAPSQCSADVVLSRQRRLAMYCAQSWL